MKEIDNIQQILPFINPTSSDDFYFMQILKRKKENPEINFPGYTECFKKLD